MAILTEFKNRPKLVSLKLTLIVATYLSLMIGYGFKLAPVPSFIPSGDAHLVKLFCWTAVSTSIAAWIVWLAPKVLHAAIALFLVWVACFLAWPENGTNYWSFSSVASAATAAIIFAFRLAQVSVLSPDQWRDNQSFQFSLRTMMIAFVVTAAFFSTRTLMEAISSSVGWRFCNIILFAFCNAALTVGFFVSALRPKYFLVSLFLAAIVFFSFTALSLYWLPEKEFSDRWSLWFCVGEQTLMHSTMVFAPLVLVRLLGYRIGASRSAAVPVESDESIESDESVGSAI